MRFSGRWKIGIGCSCVGLVVLLGIGVGCGVWYVVLVTGIGNSSGAG